jgi:hypothetical protein
MRTSIRLIAKATRIAGRLPGPSTRFSPMIPYAVSHIWKIVWLTAITTRL